MCCAWEREKEILGKKYIRQSTETKEFLYRPKTKSSKTKQTNKKQQTKHKQKTTTNGQTENVEYPEYRMLQKRKNKQTKKQNQKTPQKPIKKHTNKNTVSEAIEWKYKLKKIRSKLICNVVS